MRVLRTSEDALAVGFLFLIALIPVVEVVIRLFGGIPIPDGSAYVKHLVLLIAFFGAMITSRERRHLSLSGGGERRTYIGKAGGVLAAFLSVTFATALVWSSVSFAAIAFFPGDTVGIIPVQVFAGAMPLGFLVIAVRFVFGTPYGTRGRLIASSGFLVGTFFGLQSLTNLVFALVMEPPEWLYSVTDVWFAVMQAVAVPFIVVLIASAFLGTPIFVVLGGLAYLLFSRVFGSLEVIPNEGFVTLTGDTIPAIPLFTLAGFLLSESKAGERLVRLFRALFGWLPGGLVIAAVLVSTFFTTFTGASGVTILALGGLLYYVLTESGKHSADFSRGLLTGSGSIGLLLPPSLAIIIYGSIAQVSIIDLFLGGLLPGLLLVLAMSAFGVVAAIRRKTPLVKLEPRAAGKAILESIWEILLPLVVVLAYFTGLATLVETAAIAVIYALLVEVVIHREIKVKEIPQVALKALPIIGGVLIILAVARGLSYYIIDAQVPQQLTIWVEQNISSRFVFLILLNLVLLVTGCFMDLFSAILVVAPLVIPLGGVFGVHPVHLGIIFLANLGIGFITPPVGLNLFLASYRFETPLGKIYKNVLPFFVIQLFIVLVITYVPWFSTALLPG